MRLSNKRNVVLYLDKELIEKTRELGFNLSKTFENHMKRLILQFSTVNLVDNSENNVFSCVWWAGPDLSPNGSESSEARAILSNILNSNTPLTVNS